VAHCPKKRKKVVKREKVLMKMKEKEKNLDFPFNFLMY